MKNNFKNALLVGQLVVIMCAPLYVIRFSFWGFPSTLLEILILILFALWIVFKVVTRELLSAIPRSMIIPGILIGIGVVLGIFLSVDVIGALGYVRAYFIEPIIVGYMLYDYIKKQPNVVFRGRIFETIHLVWLAVYGQALWLSVLGIFQLIIPSLIITASQASRAHGVFNTANALALIIGPVLAVELYRYVRRSKGISWVTLLDAILLTAFLLSQSLGGIVALLVVFGVVVLIRCVPHVSLIVFISLTVLTGLFMAFVPFIAPKTDNPWVRNGNTASIRICLWEGTQNLIRDNFLWGVGLRSFPNVYSQSYVTCDAEPLLYPHNLFYNFWVEIGVLGLLGFMLVFLRIFMSPNIYSYALLYAFVHGLFDVPYFKNDLSVMFWIFTALWLITKEQRDLGVRHNVRN